MSTRCEHGEPIRGCALCREDRSIRQLVAMCDKLLLAMQACIIEAEAGNKDAALRWIWNTLDGPGLIPNFEEAKSIGGAQAYFDREYRKLPEGL